MEPFVGGCNSFKHAAGAKIGNDINSHMIDLFKAVQGGWTISYDDCDISREKYYHVRDNKDVYDPVYWAFVMICSFSGKFNGGYPAMDLTKSRKLGGPLRKPKFVQKKDALDKLRPFIDGHNRVYCRKI